MPGTEWVNVGWTDRQIDGWMDGWMEGWVIKRMNETEMDNLTDG